MDLLGALYRAFKSVKLAVTLLLLLAALALIATLAPQGGESQACYDRFPRFWAWLVTTTGFGQFSRSALFLVPAGPFFANTAVCAVDRFARRRRSSAPPRFGPDLIHLGIFVLVIGGIVTATARRDGFVYMAEGDEVRIAGEYAMTPRSYRFDKYPDGRPRDWVSTVDVTRGGTPAVTGFAIEVNRPLRLGRLKVFQASFAREARATLADAGGREMTIGTGRALRRGRRHGRRVPRSRLRGSR